ncbi:hypothetical protein ACNKHT_26405 [Shigella flexneri]
MDASRIVIKVNEDEMYPGEAGIDIYNLTKYTRSNQNTCINQMPCVSLGEPVNVATCWQTVRPPTSVNWRLVRTCAVAFMPWNGYNFEDSSPRIRACCSGRPFHHHPHSGTGVCVP